MYNMWLYKAKMCVKFCTENCGGGEAGVSVTGNKAVFLRGSEISVGLTEEPYQCD